MALPLPRRRDEEWFSLVFARAINGPGRTRTADPPAGLVGLEHEFRVLVDGQPIDFRSVIHRLPIDGRRIDPADPNAYRGSWGGTLTADGREAEIAIPPVSVAPGFTHAVAAAASVGRATLRDALPPAAELEGYSTHLSVAVPRRLVERVARRYAETFGPALMLLLDGPESPGLLVRPRPGRLELCGEFVDGERLRAAAAFVAGSVRAVVRACGWRSIGRRGLAPSIRVKLEPALDRYGWFLPPPGVAPSLYQDGRGARLRLRHGGTVSAQEHLERCWAIARATLGAAADPADLVAMDRIVAGVAPLGVELEQARAIETTDAATWTDGAVGMGPFGDLMRERSRGDLRIGAELVAWDFAVLRVSAGLRTAFACLPRPALGPALAALDAGRLDAALHGFLAARDTGRALASSRQTGSPGLYGVMSGAAKLLAPERPPLGELGDRPGKRRHQDERHREDQQRSQQPAVQHIGRVARPVAAAGAGATIFGLSVPVTAALVGGAVAVVVGGALLFGGGGAGTPIPVATGSPGGNESTAPALATTVFPSDSPSPLPSLRPSPSEAPNPFAGTYDVTWILKRVDADPGTFRPSDLPKPGSTGKDRFVISCSLGHCSVQPVSPLASVASFWYSKAVWSHLTWDGRAGLSLGVKVVSDCLPAIPTVTERMTGQDPTVVAGRTEFGAFSGLSETKWSQLTGYASNGDLCLELGYLVTFTAVRVGM